MAKVGMRVIVMLIPAAALVSEGCRHDEESFFGAGEPVPVICLECRVKGTLTIARDPSEEAWPKPCPSCTRIAAWPYKPCISCGAAVPLRDPRTGTYGSPKRCPHCGGRWEP